MRPERRSRNGCAASPGDARCRLTRATIYLAPCQVCYCPNKRLKLAGGDRLKGIGVLCPWRGTDFVPRPCAGERVARSLSVIR